MSLTSPKSHAFINSSAGDQAKRRRVPGEQTVILHPLDAGAGGITTGAYVQVLNDRGPLRRPGRGQHGDRARHGHLPQAPGKRTRSTSRRSTR
ncbi:MAG: molybdopterin dinucleotide binding domain-containing protein [Janthinobacterium lividum]